MSFEFYKPPQVAGGNLIQFPSINIFFGLQFKSHIKGRGSTAVINPYVVGLAEVDPNACILPACI